MTRVCVAGAGVIGSLLAGHLAQVADVSVLTRREEHARALNGEGLRVSGRSSRTARVTAAADPAGLPEPELVIVACKGTDLEALARRLEGHWPAATMMTIQNGLGAEEIASKLEAAVVAFQEGDPRDDLAMLVLSVVGPIPDLEQLTGKEPGK